MSGSAREIARQARRIVVKVGSGVLTDAGHLRPRVFTELARQIAALTDEGRQVVLVSSGAIAAGSRTLEWSHFGRTVPEKQAAAAVGQIGICEIYQKRFARFGRKVAQVLLTRPGLAERERFLNARHTLATLLRLGVVPIVNENDTVATEEIRFGDNDNLSATVVNLIGADLLVLLTDVEGFYAEPPQPRRPRPRLLDVVERITPEIEAAAGGSDTAHGRGGMVTKLEAARTAARSGAATVICDGRRKDVLPRLAAGEPVGTLFLAGEGARGRMASRKHWLAYTARPAGSVVVDDGAVNALRRNGGSLLPAGVVAVEGRFGIGDPVACLDPGRREIARGLAAYASAEVERIRGLGTREIGRVLGYSNGDEVIHRDDLVLVDDLPEDPEESPK